jgi:hypothetical protein
MIAVAYLGLSTRAQLARQPLPECEADRTQRVLAPVVYRDTWTRLVRRAHALTPRSGYAVIDDHLHYAFMDLIERYAPRKDYLTTVSRRVPDAVGVFLVRCDADPERDSTLRRAPSVVVGWLLHNRVI